eukprot:3974534-Amphidinium_carterae.1
MISAGTVILYSNATSCGVVIALETSGIADATTYVMELNQIAESRHIIARGAPAQSSNPLALRTNSNRTNDANSKQ